MSAGLVWVSVAAALAGGKIDPVPEAEKARLLAAETPEQKALREELAGLGWMVFNHNGLGNQDIYRMKADGSEIKRLTTDPAEDTYPHPSPDGKRILFTSTRRLTPEQEKALPCDPRFPITNPRLRRRSKSNIWVMNADGSEQRPIAHGDLAHWAPDGKRLAACINLRPRVGRAAVVDLEKKTERLLVTTAIRSGGMPCFTPDGTRVLVANGLGQLLPLNAEGNALASGGKPVTVIKGHPCNAEISPDGKWVTWVIDTHRDAGSWLCYAPFDPANTKGTFGKRLALGWAVPSVNYFPDYSPDSRLLVYVHAETQKGVKSYNIVKDQDIYITRFPGCETTVRITWTNAGCQHPHWARATATAKP